MLEMLQPLLDSAGPSGVAIVIVLALLLSGKLALGREVAREREINKQTLEAQSKLADQVGDLVRLVRERKP